MDFEVELESGKVVNATMAPNAASELAADPANGAIILADLVGTRVELKMDGDDWVVVRFDTD